MKKIINVPENVVEDVLKVLQMGFYQEQGIKANLLKRAGWALVRDQMMNRGQCDPLSFSMPLAVVWGLARQQT